MQRTVNDLKIKDDSEDNTYVTPDFSVFRTQLPRPTSTMVHLLIASLTFILALIVAIFYAEG